MTTVMRTSRRFFVVSSILIVALLMLFYVGSYLAYRNAHVADYSISVSFHPEPIELRYIEYDDSQWSGRIAFRLFAPMQWLDGKMSDRVSLRHSTNIMRK